jgi:hypothetical protein
MSKSLLGSFCACTVLSSALAMSPAPTFAAQKLEIDSWPGLAGQPQSRRDLVTEYIRIPSTAQPPGTPSELNQTNFIRVRRRDGDLRHADAILIQAIPNGASSFSESAAQLVETAARLGKTFEVWGIERREKNLEDLSGLREAIVAHDPKQALQYYYGDHYLDANGKFAGRFGAPGAKFQPLTQADVPFLADWGADIMNRDIESVIDLVPAAERRTNVFLYSASPGGFWLSQFAGFKLSDGHRGYQEIAGLVAIEGQLTKTSIGVGQPSDKDVKSYIDQVQAIRDGKAQRFQDRLKFDLLSSGPSIAVPAAISTLAAQFQPDEESIFPIAPGAVGGPAADAFTAALRLTNFARAGFDLSDDPLPGSLTATWFHSTFGGGLGRLDFVPRPGAPRCAQPGPTGMQPPCVPAVAQIDPKKVYGWLDGGPGGAAAGGSPLEGWSVTPDGDYTAAWAYDRPDPARLETAVQTFARPATFTNAVPLTVAFPSGPRKIDSGFNLGWAWYASNRYHGVDVPFINRFQKVYVDRPDLNIHLDFDKTAIDAPIIEFTVHLGTTNPWPDRVKDFTVVDLHGLTETPEAARKSPIDPRINLASYKNLDIHTADNSNGGEALDGSVVPGTVGANPISDVLPGWISARMGSTGVDLPSFQVHPTSRAE